MEYVYEKDFKDVTKFWEEEVLPQYTYVEFFLSGLDTDYSVFKKQNKNETFKITNQSDYRTHAKRTCRKIPVDF